mgnify:CR=1 FL=1
MAVVNVKSEIAGNVWKIQTKPGDRIEVDGQFPFVAALRDGEKDLPSTAFTG